MTHMVDRAFWHQEAGRARGTVKLKKPANADFISCLYMSINIYEHC